MQRGVVAVLKDIWATLKKEIKGPQIKELKLRNGMYEIKEKKLKDKIECLVQKMDSKVEVYDMNSENRIEVKEASFSKKIEKEVFLLEDLIKIGTEKLKIEKYKIEVNEKKIKKLALVVNSLKIRISDELKVRKKISEIYVKINNGKKKIIEIPKRLKGKTIYHYRKKELEIILKKIKEKMRGRSMGNYNIEGIFEGIPVKNIRNIKYFKETNSIELYFNGKSFEGSYSQFVILSNKNNALLEKIFI